jgi:hypothetical protein
MATRCVSSYACLHEVLFIVPKGLLAATADRFAACEAFAQE